MGQLKQRFSRWREHRFFRAVLVLAGATVASQLALLAASPLLTRLYLPEHFGLMAVFMAVASTVLTVSSARYELAIVLPKDGASARPVWELAQRLNLATSLIFGLALLAWGPALSRQAGHPGLVSILWLMPLYVWVAGLFRANHYWALREQGFRAIGRSKFSQVLGAVALQVALGLPWVAGGAAGLIAGQALGQGLGGWRLGRALGLRHTDYRPLFRFKSSAAQKDAARAFQRFPLFDLPASLVDVLSVQLPNLLLATMFSAQVAGWHVLAERMVMLPVALVGQAVGQALLGFSQAAKAGAGLYPMALRAVGGLGALALAPTLVLFLWGPSLFAMVFGSQWHIAGEYASWLMLGAAVQLVYAPVSLLLMASEGQKLNLGIHTFMLLGKSLALALGAGQADPLLAVQGLACVSALGYAVATVLVLRHLRAHPSAKAPL
jgi:O-antigen/teichoic acid export membrane protein